MPAIFFFGGGGQGSQISGPPVYFYVGKRFSFSFFFNLQNISSRASRFKNVCYICLVKKVKVTPKEAYVALRGPGG
jgi:hypothetical protein